MNKLSIISMLLLIGWTGCKRVDNRFELSGNVIGDTDGIVVLIQVGQFKFDAETSPILDGKFHITGSLEYPEVFSLMTENPDQSIFRPITIFIAPNDKIEIEINTENIEKSVMKGSFVNDEFQRYLNTVDKYGDDQLDLWYAELKKAKETNDTFRIKELENQGDVLYAELKRIRAQKAYEYIKANPKSFVSAYSLYRYSEELDVKQIDELLNMLDKNLYNSKYINNIVNADRNQLGMKASDFTLKDIQDNEIVFSRFSKDKIILLEFGASWCGPCRKNNPILEEIYQQYKDKGFEILGISQDRDMQTLQKSIETDQITWTNLLDVKGNKAVKDLYNTSSLPAYILIDRNGIVVARNVSISDIENEIVKLLR